MTNGNANGLDLMTLVGALVHGKKEDIAKVETAHAATGLKVVAGEIFENMLADRVAKGFRGVKLLREIMRSTGDWAKYGLEGISIAVAPVIAKKIGELAGKIGLDARTCGYIETFFVELGEGMSRGVISASDPRREDKIEKVAELVVKRFDNAFRDHFGVIHLARINADGTVAEDGAREPRPLSCSHWQQTVTGWDLSHPDVVNRGNNGGNNNRQNQNHQPTTTFGAKIPYERGTYDTFTAGQSEPNLCRLCFSLSGAAVPSGGGKTFWQKIEADKDVTRVLLAVVTTVQKSDNAFEMTKLLECLEKNCSFEALRIICNDVKGRLQPVVKSVDIDGTMMDVVDDYEISAKDLTKFKGWIDGLGGAGLSVADKAEDTLQKAWKQSKLGGIKFWLGSFSSLYVAAAVILLYVYFMGWFHPAGWLLSPGGSMLKQNICLLVGSIGALFWVVPWYMAGGLSKLSHGFIDVGSDLAQTARSIATLLFGFGSALAVIKMVIFLLGWKDDLVMISMIPVFMSILAYDRLVARWFESPKVKEIAESIAGGQAKALSALFTVGILLAATSGYVDTLRAGTVFQVVVEYADVGGKSVSYIPTPNSGAFLPTDILGKIVAGKMAGGAAGTKTPVCLPKGATLSLPGYAVQKEEPVNKDCPAETVSWTTRPAIKSYVPKDGAKEYGSLEEISAIENPPQPQAVAAAPRASEAYKPKVAEAAAATRSAPAPLATAPQEATVASDHDDLCKRIAAMPFATRHARGCI